MKRITLWALSTLCTLVLLFGYSTSTSGPLATSDTTSVHSGSFGASSTPGHSSGLTTNGGGTASGSSGNTGGTASGTTVDGDIAQTRWGPVQVELTVAAGKITGVTVLLYPNGNGRDEEINSYALPILTRETIDAQSANVDMVSGATVTSDGYLHSLQSALDKASL